MATLKAQKYLSNFVKIKMWLTAFNEKATTEVYHSESNSLFYCQSKSDKPEFCRRMNQWRSKYWSRFPLPIGSRDRLILGHYSFVVVWPMSNDSFTCMLQKSCLVAENLLSEAERKAYDDLYEQHLWSLLITSYHLQTMSIFSERFFCLHFVFISTFKLLCGRRSDSKEWYSPEVVYLWWRQRKVEVILSPSLLSDCCWFYYRNTITRLILFTHPAFCLNKCLACIGYPDSVWGPTCILSFNVIWSLWKIT